MMNVGNHLICRGEMVEDADPENFQQVHHGLRAV